MKKFIAALNVVLLIAVTQHLENLCLETVFLEVASVVHYWVGLHGSCSSAHQPKGTCTETVAKRRFTRCLVTLYVYSWIFPIQTRLQSRRRPASAGGTKRKSSCPAAAVSAVVGEAPLPPSSPFEHQVVVENLDVDLAPPSVVIREAAKKKHI